MSAVPPTVPNPANANLFALLRGLAGMALGGIVGIVLFELALLARIQLLVLPGAAVGMACGHLMGKRSLIMGFVCGIVGLGITLGLEWWHFPFLKDRSLGFFLTHVGSLPTFKLIVIAAATILAAWFGAGRDSAANNGNGGR